MPANHELDRNSTSFWRARCSRLFAHCIISRGRTAGLSWKGEGRLARAGRLRFYLQHSVCLGLHHTNDLITKRYLKSVLPPGESKFRWHHPSWKLGLSNRGQDERDSPDQNVSRGDTTKHDWNQMGMPA